MRKINMKKNKTKPHKQISKHRVHQITLHALHGRVKKKSFITSYCQLPMHALCLYMESYTYCNTQVYSARKGNRILHGVGCARLPLDTRPLLHNSKQRTMRLQHSMSRCSCSGERYYQYCSVCIAQLLQLWSCT